MIPDLGPSSPWPKSELETQCVKSFYAEKLVRDRIPEIIEGKGDMANYRVADREDYVVKLHDKLLEECNEFKETPSVEELADILEVIRSIYVAHNFSPAEVERVRLKKREERGGFEIGYILKMK